MTVCFATNNPHKLEEVKALLPEGFILLSLEDIGCREVLPEEQTTLEGNSLQKAKYIYDQYKIPCFADDTGLEVYALDGAPGVYSARYAGPENNSDRNIDLLLQKLSGVEERQAQFRTVITLVTFRKIRQFEGLVKGNIRETRSGSHGFGYDPVFEPKGYEVTFSQMDRSEKNRISHRGKAIRKLIDYLNDHPNLFLTES